MAAQVIKTDGARQCNLTIGMSGLGTRNPVVVTGVSNLRLVTKLGDARRHPA